MRPTAKLTARLTARQAEWGALGAALAAAGAVFWQIRTVLAPQGMAEGGPYDNAAFYPGLVAAVLVLLVALQALLQLGGRMRAEGGVDLARLGRPVAVVALFGLYIAAVGPLGYHLATAPMLLAVMAVCGMRNWLAMAAIALGLSFGLAWLFETRLNVVLPGGVYGLNLDW